MRIAVNTRFLLPHKMEGFGWFTYEVVKRMVENHPEHTFIFFFDRPYEQRFIFADNVIPVVLRPPARHPILFYIWFEISVKRALKKYRADLFFSPDGYLSLGTDIPQYPVIHDLNFEHYPHDLPFKHRIYYRKFFPEFAKKARKIITVSHYSKQDITDTYGIPPEKIEVAWNGASEKFVPLAESVKQQVRSRYTEGQRYFVFIGALHPRKNIGRLLQAFQEYCDNGGSTDLLIIGENLFKKQPDFLKGINLEVRKRIRFTGHLSLEELVEATASAEALVFVPYFEGFGIPVVEAMRCGIPVIAGNLTSLPEVAGDAALYVDPYNVSEIAGAMQRIEADNGLWDELSAKGLQRSRIFSWDKTAEKVWEVISSEK